VEEVDRKKSLILIALSSLFFVLASPGFVSPWLSLFFLVPSLIVYSQVSVKEAFFYGFLQGILSYGGANYWFAYSAIVMFDMTLLLAVPLYLFMAALFYGLYLSFFSSSASWIFHITSEGSLFKRVLLSAVSIPLLWMTVEIFRGFIFPQFNITEITSFFYQYPLFLQLVSVVGEHLFSLIIIFVNVGIYFAVKYFLDQRKGEKLSKDKKSLKVLIPLIFSVVLVALSFLYGSIMGGTFYKTEKFKDEIISLQLNISHKKKWKRQYYNEILNRYIAETKRALKSKTKIVIWPETAINFYPQRESDLSIKLLDFADSHDIIILSGGPEYEVVNGKTKYYNAVFKIGNNEIKSVYRKEKLLPFAEHCPVDALMFLYKIANNGKTNQFYSYNKNRPVVAHKYVIGMGICYESTFPFLIKERSLDSDLLVIFSDDVWLGNTSGPEQHIATEVLRAIETRKWIIASVNSGISALISPEGDIVKRIGFGRKGIIRFPLEKKE